MSNFYKINDEKVVVRKIENHVIILDVDTGDFISADDTARLIIEQIIEGKNDDEIIEEIIKKYECPSREEIVTDFQEFILELQQKGIIMS